MPAKRILFDQDAREKIRTGGFGLPAPNSYRRTISQSLPVFSTVTVCSPAGTPMAYVPAYSVRLFVSSGWVSGKSFWRAAFPSSRNSVRIRLHGLLNILI